MNYDDYLTHKIAQMYGIMVVSSPDVPAGKSYIIDPKAMKAHDLSQKGSAFPGWARDPSKDYGPSLTRQMLHQQIFYGTADPLAGTPWGAAADRFKEAVAAAGTELEWR